MHFTCPKVLFYKHGFFDVSLKTTQDYTMWFRLAQLIEFIQLPDECVTGRIHDEQTGRRLDKVALKEKLEFRRFFAGDIRQGKFRSPEEITKTKALLELSLICFRFKLNGAGFYILKLAMECCDVIFKISV